MFLLDKELQRLRIAMKSLLAANDEKVRGHVMSHRAGCVFSKHGSVKACYGCCCVEDQKQLISPGCPQAAAHQPFIDERGGSSLPPRDILDFKESRTPTADQRPTHTHTRSTLTHFRQSCI